MDFNRAATMYLQTILRKWWTVSRIRQPPQRHRSSSRYDRFFIFLIAVALAFDFLNGLA